MAKYKHIGTERWFFTGISTLCGIFDRKGAAYNAPICPACLRIQERKKARRG
jgi:hypothetical protein